MRSISQTSSALHHQCLSLLTAIMACTHPQHRHSERSLRSEGRFCIARLSCDESPLCRLPQARSLCLGLGSLLDFPGYATNPMNLRVPHPSRLLRRVGSYDPTPVAPGTESVPGSWVSLGFPWLRHQANELEGAPSFASSAKGGLLRSNVPTSLVFASVGTATLDCAPGFLFSVNSAPSANSV